jgi:ADP-ribose pyrophosphatase
MAVERLSSREVYRNRWMTLREDRIRLVDGSEGIYGVVTKPDFALVIPRENDSFYLVEQFRYPVGERFREFPQGAWETRPDAAPEMVAAGELREETGLSAGRMTYLGYLYVAYGFLDQKMHVFLAEELTRGEAAPEPEELDLICVKTTIATFEADLREGRIKDSASISAYALLKASGR